MKKGLKISEIVLLIPSLSGISLQMLDISLGGKIMIVALNLLALFYVIFGFKLYAQPDTPKLAGFASVMAGLAIWANMCGIQFGALKWPGYELMFLKALIVSVTLLVIGVGISATKVSFKKYRTFYYDLFLRYGISLLLLGLVYMLNGTL